jgi:perosamine synthetase
MIRPISISLSPNTEQDDIWLAFGLLFQPWKWGSGKAPEILEKKFAERFGVRHAFAFNSGRSSFLAILESLGLQKGDEVLLQAFTCNAVPNPILWAGLKPVYVDCNEDDFNINVADLERKITSKNKVVIVQHTFGLPADIDGVIEICKKHNLILIEDCAHALGAKYKGREVGTFGKAAFFSFSRDKVISSVYGGMVTTGDDILAKKIKEFQEKSGYPSVPWVLQQLWHPVYLNWKILPLYGLVGKYLLVLAQQLRMVSKAVHWKEKRGMKPAYFPKRMPNALAVLALRQLEKLDRFNGHRKEIARKYFAALEGAGFELPKDFAERENIFLRFAIKHSRAHEITKKAWKQNLLLGDWYTSPLAPGDTQVEKLGYEKGSCPKAEKLAEITLNLPTHINIKEKEQKKIIQFIEQHALKT